MIEKFKKMPCFLKIISVVILVLLHFNASAQKDTVVVISTSYGVIKLKLYDDTPIHKQNFLKLVRNGVYDSLLFHRIINGFMIQGGDPDSKRADANQSIGNGDIGYTLPAEINPTHCHKKGALAAARQGDDVNPDKRSSGCQFYIVHGKKFSELDMVTVESRMASQLKQSLILKYLGKAENITLKERYTFHQQARNNDSLSFINKQIQPIIEAEMKNHKLHKFSKEEKLIYSTVGGSPHLDGNYTVFGEVMEGIEVVDTIAEAEASANGRPINDIRMKVTLEVTKY